MMRLGKLLRELWRRRLLAAACALAAALAAVWSVAEISVAPPGVKPRNLQMASATTRMFVDAPSPSVLDLAVSVNDFEGMKNRALLVGNIMAAAPVRQYIARRAGVPPERLQISSPVTPEWPRPLASNGNEKHTTDILKSPDEHRISISVNPTVPMVDVFAEAPSLDEARQLADAAVTGMQDYLRDQGAEYEVASGQQVHLQQLGGATATMVASNVNVRLALLVFLLVFAACGGTVVMAGRIRRGWAEGEGPAPRPTPAGAAR